MQVLLQRCSVASQNSMPATVPMVSAGLRLEVE
jgi:hypothetical protein